MPEPKNKYSHDFMGFVRPILGTALEPYYAKRDSVANAQATTGVTQSPLVPKSIYGPQGEVYGPPTEFEPASAAKPNVKQETIERAGLSYQPQQYGPPAPPNTARIPDTEALLGQVTDPNSSVSKVIIRGPDGSTVQVEGDSPSKILSAAPQPGQAEVRPPSGSALSAPSQQVSATLEQPERSPSFVQNALAELTSPRGRVILGQLAQAVTGERPDSFGYLAGQLGIDLAQRDAAQQFREAVKLGQRPDDRILQALTPEQRAGILAEAQAEKEFQLKERQVALDEKVGAATTDLRKAQTEAIPVDQQLQREQLTSRENIAQLEAATRLKVAEISNENKYMRINNTTAFNFKTGEVVNFADPSNPSGVGNIKSADYKQFLDLVTGEFLPTVWDQNSERLKALGYSSLKQLTDAMTDPETGTVVFQQVLAQLPEQERVNFAEAFSQYVTAEQSGITRDKVFLARMAERLKTTIPPGFKELGDGIILRESDGVKARRLPNGKFEIIE